MVAAVTLRIPDDTEPDRTVIQPGDSLDVAAAGLRPCRPYSFAVSDEHRLLFASRLSLTLTATWSAPRYGPRPGSRTSAVGIATRLTRRYRVAFRRKLYTTLEELQADLDAWMREYNEERPKKRLGGLTPAAYGRRLMSETSTVTAGL